MLPMSMNSENPHELVEAGNSENCPTCGCSLGMPTLGSVSDSQLRKTNSVSDFHRGTELQCTFCAIIVAVYKDLTENAGIPDPALASFWVGLLEVHDAFYIRGSLNLYRFKAYLQGEFDSA